MNQTQTYDDFSSYGHMLDHFILEGVVCIGWLDVRERFPTGDVPVGIAEKIRQIACANGPVKALVEPSREQSTCPECGALDIRCGSSLLPDAELWIPSKDRFFSSPVAIIHYIEVHKYLPPIEYLDAVQAFDLTTDFVADVVYREKLVVSGWFESKFAK
jgi:hypothetical protein